MKNLAAAGATVCVGTWPPVLGIFEKSLSSGKLDEDLILPDGSKMDPPKIYALDATFDYPEDVPEDVKTNKRYAGATNGYTISEVAKLVEADFGKVCCLPKAPPNITSTAIQRRHPAQPPRAFTIHARGADARSCSNRAPPPD